MPACLSAARDGCQAIWLTPVPGRAARLVLWLTPKTSPATRQARSQRLMSLFPANVSPGETGNNASKRIDHTESGYCSRISGGSARTLVYAHLCFLNISTLIYTYERISARAAEIFSSQMCSRLSAQAMISGAFSWQSAKSRTTVLPSSA